VKRRPYFLPLRPHVQCQTKLIALVLVFGIVLLGQSAMANHVALRDQPLLPLPKIASIDLGKVRLGEQLFHDVRLSGDDTISCATCHDLTKGGADGRKMPLGIDGTEGTINTPTVFNSTLSLSQFWNGRAASLEEQAAGPVHNPAEMGSNWSDVVEKLNLDAKLKATFKKSYPDGITSDAIVDAIATFERTLMTYGAPFDKYLQGDTTAISKSAKKGYELFQSYGCTSCHQGANVGGNMYQTMGTMGDYFGDKGHDKAPDQGRYDVTGRERDRHVFKVPSLRMVIHTAPYFHDGSAATLEEAVRMMAKYQLGRELPDQDLAPIIDFLKSLAGTYTRYTP